MQYENPTTDMILHRIFERVIQARAEYVNFGITATYKEHVKAINSMTVRLKENF